MSKYSLQVSIIPQRALELIKDNQDADLVHEELHDVGEGKFIGTLIFEKYFFRVKNRVALVVIADNLKSTTEVRVISTAGSEGLFFNFDWGASDDFADSIQKILSDYIVG